MKKHFTTQRTAPLTPVNAIAGFRIKTLAAVFGAPAGPGASAVADFIMRNVTQSIGRELWVIAEGYIPGCSHGPEPEFTSHETACILNANAQDAHVEFTIYFEDREPAGPYRVVIPARRTKHIRFNELRDPAPIPKGTPYSSVIRSNVPVVVQHTRLDSRQAENALLSTIAFAAD